jgi:cysteine desulfurase
MNTTWTARKPETALRSESVEDLQPEPLTIHEPVAAARRRQPIYLDYNATTPLDPKVTAAMQLFLTEELGNPSSSHWFGQRAKTALERARVQVAALLSCEASEIIFTSGGTESNNLAIIGGARARRHLGAHIISSQIEHPSVREVCRALERDGFQVTYLPVDERGQVSLAAVEGAIREDTILITIMHANNETGMLQPIEAIAQLADEQDIMVHTDAAQSAGKIPTDIESLGVDLLSFAGHKLYGPKGVGVLFVRSGLQLERVLHGAGHERGLRPGTENVLALVGLGKACELAKQQMSQNLAHAREMRNLLYQGLHHRLKHIRINGDLNHTVPNTLSIGFRGINAHRLLKEIQSGIAASTGSACHSAGRGWSEVLKAMRVPEEWARGTVRLSVGKFTTRAEIERAVNVIAEAVVRLEL